MIYALERRRKGDLGFRMWRPVKESPSKMELELEANQLNDPAMNDIFEYTVVEKPE